MCKRTQQLSNYMANNVGSCGVRDGSGVQTGATTLKIMWPTMLAVFASVMAVVCKRTQQLSNYVADNVGSCCVRDGSGVQTGATTLSNVGTCSASWEGYNL